MQTGIEQAALDFPLESHDFATVRRLLDDCFDQGDNAEFPRIIGTAAPATGFAH